MKELAIHCTIYVQNEYGWNEDNPDENASKYLDFLRLLANDHDYSFDYQIYDSEVRDV